VVIIIIIIIPFVMGTVSSRFSSVIRYHCTRRNYKDNISGRNFEEMLSYGPIDVVYTWVNGSDPRWLAKKREYEM